MLDTEEIRVTGFRSMFNFLHFFGFPAVAKAVTNEEVEEARRSSDAGDDDDNHNNDDGDGNGTVNTRTTDDDFGTNLLDHMTKNLDNEVIMMMMLPAAIFRILIRCLNVRITSL